MLKLPRYYINCPNSRWLVGDVNIMKNLPSNHYPSKLVDLWVPVHSSPFKIKLDVFAPYMFGKT